MWHPHTVFAVMVALVLVAAWARGQTSCSDPAYYGVNGVQGGTQPTEIGLFCVDVSTSSANLLANFSNPGGADYFLLQSVWNGMALVEQVNGSDASRVPIVYDVATGELTKFAPMPFKVFADHVFVPQTSSVLSWTCGGDADVSWLAVFRTTLAQPNSWEMLFNASGALEGMYACFSSVLAVTGGNTYFLSYQNGQGHVLVSQVFGARLTQPTVMKTAHDLAFDVYGFGSTAIAFSSSSVYTADVLTGAETNKIEFSHTPVKVKVGSFDFGTLSFASYGNNGDLLVCTFNTGKCTQIIKKLEGFWPMPYFIAGQTSPS